MKILIVTQAVDTEDQALGFFVRWIEEFKKHFKRVEVICLKEGEHASLTNVSVHSLGKERRAASQIVYAFRFLALAWKLRNDYDAVFVHMNQEYILIAGWLWKLLGKRVYMWRNHYAGSWRTNIAAAFCDKIFCTSKHSYTAKYKNTVLMPVGIDTERFTQDTHTLRKPKSILFLSRIAPSKRPEMLVDALAMLARDGISFTADIYGSPLPRDEEYWENLKKKINSLGIGNYVTCYPGPLNYQSPDIFRSHEIFVNASPSGMLDKTIFEAAASGCLVLASSDDFATVAGEDFHFNSAVDLAALLKKNLTNSANANLSALVEKNSLPMLGRRLAEEMNV